MGACGVPADGIKKAVSVMRAESEPHWRTGYLEKLM
jgi:hypothetical protein